MEKFIEKVQEEIILMRIIYEAHQRIKRNREEKKTNRDFVRLRNDAKIEK